MSFTTEEMAQLRYVLKKAVEESQDFLRLDTVNSLNAFEGEVYTKARRESVQFYNSRVGKLFQGKSRNLHYKLLYTEREQLMGLFYDLTKFMPKGMEGEVEGLELLEKLTSQAGAAAIAANIQATEAKDIERAVNELDNFLRGE